MAAHLIRADPANRARYRANSLRLVKQVDRLDERLEERLKRLRGIPYLVFHDAYPYLERRYGLRSAGAFSANPNTMVGARRMAEFHRFISRKGIRCIFQEPQLHFGAVHPLLSRLDVKIGSLDPIGTRLQTGPGQWFVMMEDLADELTRCLSE